VCLNVRIVREEWVMTYPHEVNCEHTASDEAEAKGMNATIMINMTITKIKIQLDADDALDRHDDDGADNGDDDDNGVEGGNNFVINDVEDDDGRTG
jgi:hypothetical protein